MHSLIVIFCAHQLYETDCITALFYAWHDNIIERHCGAVPALLIVSIADKI